VKLPRLVDSNSAGNRFTTRRNLAVFGLPLLTVLAWGGSFPVAKAILPSVNAPYLSAERYAFASLTFAIILWLVEGRRALRFDGHFRQAFVLGSVGFAGFGLLAFLGLAHTRPQNAALFVATMPLLTILVLWVRRGAKPSRATLAFMLVALIGVGLVVTRGSLALVRSGEVGVGDLEVLLGVLCWVIYTVGVSSFPGWSPLRYTTLTALSGAVTIAAITATATALGLITAPSVHQTLALAPQTAYMIIPATVVAVLAWNMGIKRLGAQNTVLFINLVPLTTLAIAIAQGYKVVGIELVGVAVTILAVTGNNVWQRRAAAPTTTYAETSVAKAA